MNTCNHCHLPVENELATGDSSDEMLCAACITLLEDAKSVRVSPLEYDDLELVLAWRSHPDVYRHLREQEGPLDWDEHVSWFETRPETRYDFVIHYDGRRVGGISIDETDSVGIYLGDASARGHGVATLILAWLCERFQDRTPLTAEIHVENTNSQALFERCGFRITKQSDEWLEYEYSRS